jgi:hypothetical protein
MVMNLVGRDEPSTSGLLRIGGASEALRGPRWATRDRKRVVATAGWF